MIETKELKNSNMMSLFEHLGELRGRLLKIVIALVVMTFVGFSLSEYFIKLLMRPLDNLTVLQAIDVTENISVFMRVSLLSGIIVASPYVLFQILAFVLPALKKTEKRWLVFFVIFASVMFVVGVVFAYLVMLPAAIPFLVGFLGNVGIVTTPRLSNYFEFVTNLLFWIGVSFEMPLVVFILSKFGLVNARQMIKLWRQAIVVIAVLAAVISPTVDPINMGLIMLPLLFLYLVSILMSSLARRGKNDKEETENCS